METRARIHALARKAERSKDLMPLYQALWTLISTGSPAEVAELLDDSRGQMWPDPRKWVYHSLCDYLPGAPDPNMVAIFLNHLKTVPWMDPVVLRGAEMLALTQPRATVKSWLQHGLEETPFQPVLGLIAHTLSLQGWHGGQTELGEQIQAALAISRSPVAALPLTLHPDEGAFPLRTYRYVLGTLGGESMAGVGVAFPASAQSPSWRTVVSGRPDRLNHVLDMTALTAPFEGWEAHSNGQIEAGAFRLATPVAVLDATVIGSLPLASVASPASVVCMTVRPQAILEQCFIAASGGGMYGGARYGAMGRLAAWQALGALTGSPFTGKLGELMEVAAECRFVFYTDPQSPFFDKGSEVAIACLRADRQTLVVLAATDTD